MCKRWSVALAVLCFVAAFVAAPAAPGSARPQPAAKTTPIRLDQYGDPLPEHALLRIGTSRNRNNAAPQALAFVRGTNRLVTIDQGTAGHVWDATTGQELLTFGRLLTGYAPFAISPDGSLAAFVESLEVCGISETKTGKSIQTLKGDWAKVQKLCFSPDNSLLVATDTNSHVMVWEVAQGVLREQLDREDGDWRRLNISFSPDGKVLALGSWFGAVNAWDLASRRHFTIGPKTGGCAALAFSPDGKYLATISSDPHRCTLWEIATGKQIHEFPSQGPNWCVSFAPDGKSLATGNGAGTVSLWDTATGKLERKVSQQSGDVDNLVFSSDGKFLATASGGCTIGIWDVVAGKQQHLIPGHHLEVMAARFMQDGNIVSLCRTWYGESMLRISDATSGKTRRHTALHSQHVGAWLAADGAIVAMPSDGTKVVLQNAMTGKGGPTIDPGDETVHDWHVSQNGRAIAAVIGQPAAPGAKQGTHSSIMVWNAGTGSTLVSHTAKEKQFFTCQFTDDGRYFAVLTKVPAPFSENDILLQQLGVIRPDNPSLYTGNSLAFWDLATGHKTSRVGPALVPPRLGVFSPTGRLMVAEERTGQFSVLELCTGKNLAQLQYDGDKLSCFAFSPDGRIVAAATAHGSIVLWDLTLGNPIADLQSFQQGIHTLSFSKDSKRLLSCSQDMTILVWDVAPWTARALMPKTPLEKQDLATLWGDLGNDNPVTAHTAMSQLIQFPKESIAHSRKHLQPSQKLPVDDLARWIADLGSDRFAVREESTANIRKLGHAAQPALEKTLAGKPNLEVMQRVRHLLTQLETQALPREQLQQLRALDTLERLATPDAIELLETLSKGDPNGWLTQEASWVLKRLRIRETSKK